MRAARGVNTGGGGGYGGSSGGYQAPQEIDDRT